MYKKEKFEQIYQELLDVYENKIEEHRKLAILEKREKKSKAFKILISCTTVIILLAIILNTINNSFLYSIILVTMCGIFAFGISSLIDNSQKNNKKYEYHLYFKKYIINYFVSLFSDDFKYTTKGIDEKVYNEANFEKAETIASKELIKGTSKEKIKFEISKVFSFYEHISLSLEKSLIPGFEGIFASLEINEPTDIEIYIRNSKISSYNATYGNQKIEMDSSDFEEIFNVYCHNSIVAMQILTAEIQEILVEFHKSIKKDFDIAIKGNKIYFRINKYELFEISDIDKSILEKENIYNNYIILEFIFDLSTKIKKLISETPL